MKRRNIQRLAALALSAAMAVAAVPAALADSGTGPAAMPPEAALQAMDALADSVPQYVVPETDYPPMTTEEMLAEEAKLQKETPQGSSNGLPEEPQPPLVNETGGTLQTAESGEPVDVQADGNYIDSTFGYTLKGDPGYISDREFFGEWDAANNKWTVNPKFDYGAYPNMAPLETAVKNGDYAEAKEALFNYYIKKEEELERKKDISTTVKDTITADLLQENFMYNGNSGLTPCAILTVGDTNEYVSADITDIVKSNFTKTTELSFYVVATNKNGDMAKFYSKEAGLENAPYLQVRVNGTDLTLYPSNDTYISAGSNKGVNYGSRKWLEAEEDPSSIGTKDLVGNATKRTYIRFTLDGLKEGDTITSATLNMKGFNAGSLGTGDIPVEEGKTEEQVIDEHIAGAAPKDVVVIHNGDTSWKESNLTYSNASAQLIYSYDQDDTWQWNQPSGSGYRYPEELLRFNTWYDKLVKLYNATGDEAYAYTALRQLMDFITVSTGPGKQKPWLKTLDVAVRTQCIPGLTMQLINSEYMTADIFTGFMKYMWDQANDAKSFNTEGNWGSSETLGLYTVAANFQEFSDSGVWIARVKTRYDTICGKIMLDDKTCTELALGYTDYAISSTIDAKTVADQLGIEEYPFTEQTLNAILGLAQYMMYASMPGYHDHQEGDGYSHRGDYTGKLERVGRWFNDPHLLFAGTDGAEGYEPDFKSIMFPTGKKIAMRTGWDENANYLYTSVDGGVGSHAHPDDLNLVVQAYGQYLLVDPLYGTYSSDDRRYWLISTEGHNVVNVKDSGQNGRVNQTTGAQRGTIDKWETNEAYDFTKMTTPNDTKANYSRSILFVKPGFWLVNDYLTPKSSGSKQYIQNWHFLPEANISMDETTKTIRTGFNGVNIQVVPVAPERFDEAAIKDGYYSEGQNSFSDAKYACYTINTPDACVFNTILMPENVGQQYDISVQQLEVQGLEAQDASAYEFTLQEQTTGETTTYQYFQLHNSAKKGMHQAGDFETDADLMLLELDSSGKVQSVVAQNVTRVVRESDGTVFVGSATPVDVSMKWSVGNMMLDGSALTEETMGSANLTLYCNGNDITNVRINQTDSQAKREGDYVYFGSGPSVTPGPTPSSTPQITPRPITGGGSHGTGGGGGGGFVTNPTPVATPTPTSSVTPQPTPSAMPEQMQTEISGHWGEEEIAALYEQGVIQGDANGSLNLQGDVTRSEFIAMMVRALDLPQSSNQGSFQDVPADQWYAGVIETAKECGLIQGADGYANPEANITREEMAVMLSNAARLEEIQAEQGAQEPVFADESAIADWAAEGVRFAAKLGLLSGYPDGTFLPQANAKREEAFVVVYRLLLQLD